MIDRFSFDQIRLMLQRLTSVVTLLDEHGMVVLPDTQAEQIQIPIDLEAGKPQVIDNRTWLSVKVPPIACIVVHGTEAASVDCALLVQSLLSSFETATQPGDRNESCRRMLRDELSTPELESTAHENSIPLELERAVMVFHVLATARISAMDLLNEMIPIGDDDILVEIDRHTLALIKSMNQVETMDELQQLAEAIEQTALSETAAQVTVAVGEPKTHLSQLGESYREAWRALEVGHAFRPDQNVYVFRRLILERLLMEIPREMGQRYHHILFSRKSSKLFNEEMVHTIEMFFAKDLNLSDTARQLYIHRNTLVYRLDKVQRQTGLDLRHFDDAITFRMLFLLGKSGADQIPAIR